MDKIVLKGIEVKSLIGWHAWEREALRPLLLDLVISIPLKAASHSDHLKDTVDYESVVNDLRVKLLQQKFLLIEALAEYVAQTLLQNSAVQAVKVKVTKPDILVAVESVAVEIERHQSEPLP